MADERVYVGDIPGIFIDLQKDVSGGSGFLFYILKPDGSEVQWTPTLQGDGQTLAYQTLSAVGETPPDLNIPGKYTIQAYLILGAWKGRCDPVSFRVYDEYE